MDRPNYGASVISLCWVTAFLIAFIVAQNVRRYFQSRSRAKELKAINQFRKKDVGVDLLPSLEDKGELRVDIEFVKLGLVLNGSKRRVLNSVTGVLKSGRITAIMGKTARARARSLRGGSWFDDDM